MGVTWRDERDAPQLSGCQAIVGAALFGLVVVVLAALALAWSR